MPATTCKHPLTMHEQTPTVASCCSCRRTTRPPRWPASSRGRPAAVARHAGRRARGRRRLRPTAPRGGPGRGRRGAVAAGQRGPRRRRARRAAEGAAARCGRRRVLRRRRRVRTGGARSPGRADPRGEADYVVGSRFAGETRRMLPHRYARQPRAHLGAARRLPRADHRRAERLPRAVDRRPRPRPRSPTTSTTRRC